MLQKPFAGRASIEESINTLKILIPAKRNWLTMGGLTLWMFGWAMGESFAIKTLLKEDIPFFANVFILFWLLAWSAGGLFVVLVIFWQLIGKEIIWVDRGVLTIQKGLLGFSIKKSYEVNLIKNLEVNLQDDVDNWGRRNNSNITFMRGGKLKFDYGMKTIKCADGIDEAEARMLIARFKTNSNFREANFKVG